MTIATRYFRMSSPLTLAACAGAIATPLPASAEPLPAPAFSGPLNPNPEPLSVDAGPLGSVVVTGQLTAIAATQTNASRAGGIGSTPAFADIANGQIEVQTTGGPMQLYLQAGLYALPSLGVPHLRSTEATDLLYGAVPVAYAKAVVSPELSVQAGLLPTLVGAESTFSFQNINIERGLLWNQEPAVSRGVQASYAKGPVAATISLNDGYFSGRFNWISGSLSYTFSPTTTLAFIGATSLSGNMKATVATPLVQNNGRIFNLILTQTSGPLTLIPYLQYGHVGRDERVGVHRSAESFGGALLAKYSLGSEWAIGGRAEYLSTWGGGCGADPGCTPTNLLYGVGSSAWSVTVTPTWQRGRVFARGELSFTRIGNLTQGFGFGPDFDRRDQARAMVETGILF